MASYIPRLGYIPGRVNSFLSPTIVRGFDLAEHQTRTIRLDRPFAHSAVDVSQDLLVIVSVDTALAL